VGLAAVAPLAWSGISYLARGNFEATEDLENRMEPAGEITLERRPETAEAPAVVGSRRYDPPATSTIGVLALCLVLGLAAALALKRHAIGDYLHLSLNARSAAQLAGARLDDHQRDPNTYRHAVEFRNVTNPVVNEYLRRRLSVAQINDIYKNRVPGA